MSGGQVHEGGCGCGAIRYRVSGAPTWTAGCCCRDCARATGTPYVVWVGFPPGQVEFLAAEPTIHVSSEGVLRGYCPRCGTSLTYGRDPAYEALDPILYVAASTLDAPDTFPPTEVVWYGQRPAWFSLDSEIPLHETFSPEHAERAYTQVLKDR